MVKYRNNARTAGLLFILGFAGVPSAILLPPLTTSGNIMQAFSTNSAAVQISAFAIYVMGLACTGIAIALYPSMKEKYPSMALGAVVFRSLEGMCYIAMATINLVMLNISQQQNAILEPIVRMLNDSIEILIIGQTMCWLVGAFLYYSVFFLNGFLPRWLSLWGIVGVLLSLVAVIAGYFFGFSSESMLNSVLNMPIFFQELVFAGWLIFKGFNIKNNSIPITK